MENEIETLVVDMPSLDGKLVATASVDPDYPGIDVEFLSNNDRGGYLSRPRVLFENNNGELRTLIWDDKYSEDYTHELPMCTDYDTPRVSYNPVYEAYKILLEILESNSINDAPQRIEEAVGYLGEALA